MLKKIASIKTATVLATLALTPITYDGRQELGPLFTLVSMGFAQESLSDRGLPVFSITEAERKFITGR